LYFLFWTKRETEEGEKEKGESKKKSAGRRKQPSKAPRGSRSKEVSLRDKEQEAKASEQIQAVAKKVAELRTDFEKLQ